MIKITKLRDVEIVKGGSVETLVTDRETERVIAVNILNFIMKSGYMVDISLKKEVE